MVGVPGRSKSCSTCRARRKGCDKKHPCGQCIRIGVECGGYERQTIFVHQEVKADSVLHITPYRKPQALDITNSIDLIRSAKAEMYISAFLSEYLPTGTRAAQYPYDFVEIAHRMYPSDKAVELSLLSLALCASRNFNPGLEAYGRALCKLQTAIRFEQRSDSILTASKLLSLFEMFYGSSVLNLLSQGLNWHGHLEGQLAIIRARGPGAYRFGTSHQLFVDARYPHIIRAIKDRTRYPLNSLEWRTKPWEKHPKTSKDRLYDMLADLSEILADIDEARCQQVGISRMIRLGEIMSACRDLDQTLKRWCEEAGPLKDFLDDNGTLLGPRGPDDFALAHLTTVSWTLHIILYATICSLLQPTPDEYPAEIDPRPYLHKATKALPYFWMPGAGSNGAYLGAFLWGLCMHIVLSSPKLFAQEWDEFHDQVFMPEMMTTVLSFLASLHRTCGSPAFSHVNGVEGLQLRAMSWLGGDLL
ncbi:hypothetical protein F5Y16DRAFT_23586 [Xylariaceae sp. FL0255]|nr:hypothetical protein F5Y16DRAFT_23586 [Xylariaceae sp. FL0255]